MQLALFDLFEREEAVDQENGNVQGLGGEAELAMDIDNPLNKEGP